MPEKNIRRNNRMSMSRQENKKEPFRGVLLTFKRNFLREVFQQIGKDKLPTDTPRQKRSVIRLPNTPEIESLFLSLSPDIDSPVEPLPEIMRMKLLKGVWGFTHAAQRNEKVTGNKKFRFHFKNVFRIYSLISHCLHLLY